MRLEQLGEGLAACSGETVATHLGTMLIVEAYAFGSSNVVPGSSVAASRMEDTIHRSTGEPCLGF
jgi:hypothetical protein